MVSSTSARPRGGRPDVPAKMTSSIFAPRRVLAPCSPMTQARASTTLDLPDPLGPTTAVTPGSKSKVVAEAKDLNPRTVRLLRCKAFLVSWSGWGTLLEPAHSNLLRRTDISRQQRREAGAGATAQYASSGPAK